MFKSYNTALIALYVFTTAFRRFSPILTTYEHTVSMVYVNFLTFRCCREHDLENFNAFDEQLN